MFTSAYIIPPSPLLLSQVGGVQKEKFNDTHHALGIVRASFAALRPESILLISQYGARPHAISINIADEYQGSLQSFGDLSHYTFRGAPSLAYQLLNEQIRPLVTGITEQSLDYASIIAFLLCASELAGCSIIPLYPSPARTPQDHVRVGSALRESLSHTSRRVAVIAVGDLSHHLTASSPGGYHAEGVIFDTSVISALKKKSVRSLLEHAERYGEEVKESGILAFLILLGALEGVQCAYKQLSYEAPFGIGCLTSEYLF